MKKLKKIYLKYKDTRKFAITIMSITTIMTLVIINANINVFQITDGYTTTIVHSFNIDADAAVASSGYSLDEYGVLKSTATDNGQMVLIKPKIDISINYDSKHENLQVMQGDTVADILSDNNIKFSDIDEITPSLDTKVLENSEIKIVRVLKTTQIKTSDIEYKTIVKTNSDLDIGKTNLISQGVNGEKLETIEIITKDGIKTSEKIIKTNIIKPSVNKVVENGTKGSVILKNGEPIEYKKVITATATAYSTEGWKSKHTASGTLARVGAIAVDPKVIPIGSKLYITSLDGKTWIYGYAVAEDTGGAIKGNKIDLFFNTQKECINFGRQKALVYVL